MLLSLRYIAIQKELPVTRPKSQTAVQGIALGQVLLSKAFDQASKAIMWRLCPTSIPIHSRATGNTGRHKGESGFVTIAWPISRAAHQLAVSTSSGAAFIAVIR
jgi:hypothetical protein